MLVTLAQLDAGAISLALLASLARLVVGFGLGLLIALGIGVLLTRRGLLSASVGALLLGLQTLPSVVWAPPVILLLGDGEPAVLLATLLGSVFAMALIVRDALRSIPASYRAVGPMLGAQGLRLVRHVLLPASLPALVSGMRSGFAFCWRSLLGAEMVIGVTRSGLGASLGVSRRADDLPTMLLSLALMVVVAMLLDRLALSRIERAVHRRFALDG